VEKAKSNVYPAISKNGFDLLEHDPPKSLLGHLLMYYHANKTEEGCCSRNNDLTYHSIVLNYFLYPVTNLSS